MNSFSFFLLLATFLCALVAGITLIFAIVIMPGLKSLGDRAFLRAFQAIDGVIQNNQPIFMIVWLGSAVSLLIATILGFGVLNAFDQGILIGALIVYSAGVQATTMAINIPLNNQLQATDLDKLEDAEIAEASAAFANRWLSGNRIRTWLACLTTLGLLAVVWRC